VQEGWSVRVTEAKARETAGGARPATKGRAAVHPDQEAAMREIADVLSSALGTEVRVRARGTGYKVELAFASAEEAAALARRLGASASV
jgi:ParB family transcriptional regulator, chromosome partitioning protein